MKLFSLRKVAEQSVQNGKPESGWCRITRAMLNQQHPNREQCHSDPVREVSRPFWVTQKFKYLAKHFTCSYVSTHTLYRDKCSLYRK